MATSHGNVKIISSKQEEKKAFEEITPENIIVIQFTAASCGLCNSIDSFYAELSEKYPQLFYFRADVDEMGEFAEAWDVQAVPTFIFMQDGKLIDKLVGANKSELEKKVSYYATVADSQATGNTA